MVEKPLFGAAFCVLHEVARLQPYENPAILREMTKFA